MNCNSTHIKLGLGFVCLSLWMTLAGCGGGNGTKEATVSPVLNSLSLAPTSASLSVGSTQQFTATGLYSDGGSQDLTKSVTWSVDGFAGGDSTVGTISKGLYTPSGPGPHQISAASATDSTKSATATVSVLYTGVLTYHNDNGRTGQNLTETVLTPGTVNAQHFGKLRSYPLDGVVYAQPLYAQAVNIPGLGARNVVYVATEHDSVYAFDADGRAPNLLWQTSFINPAAGITSVYLPYGITGDLGITGTPVIDPATGTLYAVSFTNENNNYLYRLRALDITTGAEKLSGGVIIQASLPGSGGGADNEGNIAFNSIAQLQRPGLLLSKGTVYVSFGSFADLGIYHGWLLGYDAQTLQQVTAFNVTPNGSQGSLWMSGGAPAADSDGNVFVVTANGTFDADLGGADFGESILKLVSGGNALSVSDYFTPFNNAGLNAIDADLGSGGIILLPDQQAAPTHLLAGGGKAGTLYLVNRDSMGHFQPGSDSQIVQSLTNQLGAVLCTPAYWQNRVYLQPSFDYLKAYNVQGGLLSFSSSSPTQANYTGATPAISANGTNGGIVWVVNTNSLDSADVAILRAYDASDVSKELYNSNEAGTRDVPGPASGTRFTVPTVFNGKVYVATGQELDVYGPLGS